MPAAPQSRPEPSRHDTDAGLAAASGTADVDAAGLNSPAFAAGVPGAGAPGAVDEFGRVETRGIEVVDASARHGRPRELLAVWLASNTAYIYILVGGLLTVLGLSAGQAFTVLFAGNLFWVLVGFLAVSGPRSGTTAAVVTRSMYGVRGNRVAGAGVTWITCVAYEGLNLAIGSLAGFALVDYLGVSVSVAVKVLVAAAIGAITLFISVYGHATIVRSSVFFTIILGLGVLTLGGFVLSHATTRPEGFTALHGSALWSAVFIGFTIIASLPLSWGNGADYARYLPADSSPVSVAGWTALGGWLPAMVLGGIGILAGTVVDMADPQTAMQALVPGWFYAVFLLLLVLGSITNNVLTAYSSGLALQSLGVRASRAKTVIFDTVIGGAVCAYALISAEFLTSMSNLLTLTVAYLGPGLAIYATDMVLRRGHYDGAALHNEGQGSPFWFRGGINPAGVSALVVGTGVALLCVNTSVLVGPIAQALGGADISSLTGPLVAAMIYVLVSGSTLMTARQR